MAQQKLSVLVIEDDPGIVDFLEIGLRGEGFDVTAKADGIAGLEELERNPPSVLILDVMLPGMDGIEVCRRVRARSRVPIIMLTARDEVEDRVSGLNAGADDYIAKPFRFIELIARIRAVLRRADERLGDDQLSFEDLCLSRRTREVVRGDRKINLTAREFDLLEFFLRHPLQVHTKDSILQSVWGFDFYGDLNVVEVYVSYLRQKLGEPQLIHTLRGAGYVLKAPKDDG